MTFFKWIEYSVLTELLKTAVAFGILFVIVALYGVVFLFGRRPR